MHLPTSSTPFFAKMNLALSVAIATSQLAAIKRNDLGKNKGDPSHCEWIERLLPSGPRGWMAKGSIDADGPAVGEGFRDGVELDPDSGQTATSLKFPNGRSMPSEGVPYAVLPGGDFGRAVRLELGDVCIVILHGKITAAVFADIGPGTGAGHGNPKIGEYSIRVHNKLRPAAPDPCRHRDEAGRCVKILNASIEREVICLGFPDSAIHDLVLETCQEQIEHKAFGLFRDFGGIVEI